MPAWHIARFLALLSTVSAAGCAHCHSCSNGSASYGAVAPASLEQTLPEISPQGFDFDISQIGSPGEVDRALGRRVPPEVRYFSLTAEQCQCLAVANSTQGNSLAAERRSVQAGASQHHGLSEEDQVRVRALRASELEARNKSASVALENYYQIAEVEANLSIVDSSLTELDQALSKVKRLRNQGVQIPFDDSELTRQRIDLVDKQTDLELKASQLNAQLIRLLGMQTTDPNARIWPTADWKVIAEPIDMEAAVQEGLALRPEMQFLYSMQNSLNTETLGVVREVVAGAAGMLSAQSKFVGLIEILGLHNLCGKRQAKERELPIRRRQLAEFTQQRRLEITSEIQQAVRAVETRLRQIAIAKERMQSWDKRLGELRRKQKIEEASFADLSAAQLKAYEAQSDETHAIVAWKIAQVKLKEAQGKLVLECQSDQFYCSPPAPNLAIPSQSAPSSAAELPSSVADKRSDWTPGLNYRR